MYKNASQKKTWSFACNSQTVRRSIIILCDLSLHSFRRVESKFQKILLITGVSRPAQSGAYPAVKVLPKPHCKPMGDPTCIMSFERSTCNIFFRARPSTGPCAQRLPLSDKIKFGKSFQTFWLKSTFSSKRDLKIRPRVQHVKDTKIALGGSVRSNKSIRTTHRQQDLNQETTAHCLTIQNY